MTRPERSLDAAEFVRLYDAADDPWGIEGSWYEERKRALCLAALPDPRYRRAFEPGCANGALSVLLAPRCDELLCSDVAGPPVEVARTRLAGCPHVRVEQGAVPRTWLAGTFDLVVVSELAYYLDTADRAALWRAVVGSLEPGGTLLTCHWLREAPGYPVEGGQVQAELAAVPELERVVEHVERDVRVEVHARVPPRARSVAERVGLR